MFPCNIIKKPAGQTVKSERRLLYFLGYYISLLQTFIDMLSGSEIELAPVSAADMVEIFNAWGTAAAFQILLKG